MRALVAFVVALSALFGAEPVEYEVRFPNAAHHEAEISVTFPDIGQETLEVRMSRSSPGRYALHEFAKNVYRVRAFDGKGKALTTERPNPHQWDVAGHDGTIRFTYTLFGDRADGTYAAIDLSHAHLNMPAVFAWARGMEDRPIRIRFEPPDGSGWKAATQLKPAADAYAFEAPDLAYFMDSPVELSDFDLREWTVGDGKKAQTIRMAVHHEGSAREVDAYADMAKRIVREQTALFGELPAFDYGVYTFLIDYVPWASGDGMEHRNSTYCSSSRSLAESAQSLIGTVAHEFIHVWNVERLRPRSLEPFDFERANASKELWFAEGFTSYYTPVTMLRAGIIGIDGFAESIGRTLDSIRRAPGRQFVSPVEASLLAPLADGAAANDPVNHRNTFVSYYGYGAAVGLGLDLTLRTRFPDISLDDYMRAMWEKFGRDEKPYGMDDLEQVLGEITGDAAFAKTYFDAHIRGRELPGYEALLARAGLMLREHGADEASLGAGLHFEEHGAVIGSGTLIGSPLYNAGLDRGAVILEIDGRKLKSRKRLDRILRKKRPGDSVTVRYEQRGRTGSVEVALGSAARWEVVPFERADRKVTGEIRAFRQAWLGSKAGAP